MTCLGWNTKPHCMGRIQSSESAVPYNQYTAAQWLTKGTQALAGSDTPCPDISWFWLSAAAIVGMAALRAK